MCCSGWDMSGYRLQTLSPTPSEIDAAEAAEREARELGPDEPIVSIPAPCLHSLCMMNLQCTLIYYGIPSIAMSLAAVLLRAHVCAAGRGHVDLFPRWTAPRGAPH